MLINLVIDCLNSNNNNMVSSALKVNFLKLQVIHYMIKWEILKPYLKDIFTKVLKILQKLNS